MAVRLIKSRRKGGKNYETMGDRLSGPKNIITRSIMTSLSLEYDIGETDAPSRYATQSTQSSRKQYLQPKVASDLTCENLRSSPFEESE